MNRVKNCVFKKATGVTDNRCNFVETNYLTRDNQNFYLENKKTFLYLNQDFRFRIAR